MEELILATILSIRKTENWIIVNCYDKTERVHKAFVKLEEERELPPVGGKCVVKYNEYKGEEYCWLA